ncbi:MAG: 1,4-dihydroxy-2-naphthoate octaprenyltransferase [Halobacteriovoraceae bacterium]|nr:1,4-dihydroxy-2-naphthoate octaprenyltransferase [Halobacteriovoraceae bacterium]
MNLSSNPIIDRSLLKFKYYTLAIRPKTLFASMGPVILGSGLAIGKNNFSISTTFLIFICALLLQVASNLVNDYFDHINGVDNEERLGPTRVTNQGLLSIREIRWAIIIVYTIAFISGIQLMAIGGIPIIIIGLTSMFLAYIYTAGPYPLSHYALGEIIALLTFGPMAVWGTYYLHTGENSLLPLWYGLGPGLISWSLMAVNNLRDRQSDQKTNKKTLAIYFGETAGRYLCFIPILLSVFILIFVNKLAFICNLCLCFSLRESWSKLLFSPIDERLNEILAVIGKYLFLYCIITTLILYF